MAYLSVMGGTYESFGLPEVQERSVQEGFMLDLAEKIKQAVDLPIIAAGRINSPSLAENILSTSQADLIGLARMLLVDPEWVIKARSGREAEIIQCKKCDACMSSVMQGQSVLCAAWSKEKLTAVNWPWGEFRGRMWQRTGAESPVVHAALELCGRPGGPNRLPTRSLNDKERAELRQVLVKIGAPVSPQ